MNFDGMFGQAQERVKQMQEELQSKLKAITVIGDAGAGMVTVEVNGLLETTKVNISEDAYKEGALIVGELVAAAFNDAKKKAEYQKQQKLGGMMSGMGLPEGIMSFFNNK